MLWEWLLLCYSRRQGQSWNWQPWLQQELLHCQDFWIDHLPAELAASKKRHGEVPTGVEQRKNILNCPIIYSGSDLASTLSSQEIMDFQRLREQKSQEQASAHVGINQCKLLSAMKTQQICPCLRCASYHSLSAHEWLQGACG